MNDLDIHPRSSQLLLLNGRKAYHFLFVDCCFSVFIYNRFKDSTAFEVTVTACDLENSMTMKLKLQAMWDEFSLNLWHLLTAKLYIGCKKMFLGS